MTSIDISRTSTALVLIDLQYGITALNVAPLPSATIVANAVRLANAFRANGMPVVLVTVDYAADGSDALKPLVDGASAPAAARPDNWARVVAELAGHAGDIRVTKRQWGAFYGTDLDLQLRRRGIGTIVLAGIATHIGVESTARDAFERGYQQVFVEDATASPSAEAHANSFKHVFPRMGRVRATEQVVAALQ